MGRSHHLALGIALLAGTKAIAAARHTISFFWTITRACYRTTFSHDIEWLGRPSCGPPSLGAKQIATTILFSDMLSVTPSGPVHDSIHFSEKVAKMKMRAFCAGLLGVFAWLVGLVVMDVKRTTRLLDKRGGGNLLGEVRIRHERDAVDYAKSMREEAEVMWEDLENYEVGLDEGWVVVYNASNLLVEARHVTRGPYATSNSVQTRAIGFLTNTTSRRVLDYLSRAQGQRLISPWFEGVESNPVASFETRSWRTLEVVQSVAKLPGTSKPRELLTINAYDPNFELLFITKSILHDALPGASRFNAYGIPMPKKHVRAVRSFTANAQRASSRPFGTVRLNVVHFSDLDLYDDSTLSNYFYTRVYFPLFFHRLQAEMLQLEPLILPKLSQSNSSSAFS